MMSSHRIKQDGVSSSSYDPRSFPPFAVTVDLAVLTVAAGALQILLVQRDEPPFQGDWALPGGFVLQDESVEQAARRELAEETGLADATIHLEQLATYGAPDRDPRMRVVSVAHVALIADPPTPVAGGDAAAARYWPLDDLDLPGPRAGRRRHDLVALAFDHALIVADARERVRSKLEYTTLATAFAPEPFTLSDLRRIYTAVWGTEPDLANFRRKVLSATGMVVPEDGARPSGGTGGRPAQLYRRGPAADLRPPMLRSDVADVKT
jgi:8-oxo-dGTP diphosphatase